MAKKKAGGPKRKKGGKGKPRNFVLNVTNLKFIGAAFDEAIKDLEEIKLNAKVKKDVGKAISTLRNLKTATARVCPQTWYRSFETR